MFRRFVATTSNTLSSGLTTDPTPQFIQRANDLFKLHPTEIYALLESAWSFRLKEDDKPLGHPGNKTGLRALPDSILQLFDTAWTNSQVFVGVRDANGKCAGSVLWDHLIYAYTTESTQLLRIFQKLIENYARGDFEINLTTDALQWLHNSEVLWFANTPVLSSFNVNSNLRPDAGATRRNAYYRMFGFTLPGDTSANGTPYPFYQSKSSHLNYRRTFERFAEEVWIGIENEVNFTGKRPIDDAAIAFSAFEMQKNFLSQRNNGDVSKLEHYFVSMLSWFHLTLEYNSPIIAAFGINEQSPAQRLFALANIVGVPANGLSENLFRLADNMSLLLTLIETGVFNDEANVKELYTGSTPLVNMLKQIIFNYSQVTGRDLKVRAVKTADSMPLQKGSGILSGNGKIAEPA
jgi:hypothetical protein